MTKFNMFDIMQMFTDVLTQELSILVRMLKKLLASGTKITKNLNIDLIQIDIKII